MKYFGSIMDFTHQRNEDLLRVFKHQLALARHIVKSEIFDLVAKSPASRFWVSEERAAVVVSRMLSGKPLSGMRRNKREMFEEIYRRFLIERNKNPDKTIPELVTVVVNQPAPQFYLTARTVGEFLYRMKNGWYEKQQARCRRNNPREQETE